MTDDTAMTDYTARGPADRYWGYEKAGYPDFRLPGYDYANGDHEGGVYTDSDWGGPVDYQAGCSCGWRSTTVSTYTDLKASPEQPLAELMAHAGFDTDALRLETTRTIIQQITDLRSLPEQIDPAAGPTDETTTDLIARMREHLDTIDVTRARAALLLRAAARINPPTGTPTSTEEN